MTDEKIRLEAITFAKKNKNRIAKDLTDPKKYIPVAKPLSIFMAGSPGAGKTELSKSFLSFFKEEAKQEVIRIDGDEIRSRIPGYNGKNSYLFQGAISLIVEKVHDDVLHQSQSFIFDGTFAKYEKAVNNVERSLARNRPVFIFYVFQKPEVAWKFTEAREKVEGRNIPKSAFVEQFLGAKETVDRFSRDFGARVTVYLVKKDFRDNTVENIVKIDPKTQKIDDYIEWEYIKEALKKGL